MSGSLVRRNVHFLLLFLLAPGLVLSAPTTTARASVGTGRTAAGPRARTAAGTRRAPVHVRDITLRVDPQRLGFGHFSETWGDNLVRDMDRDGNPDVLLSNHTQPWQLWLGRRRGGFTLAQELPRNDFHNCIASDFGGPAGHRDRRVDLYCVRGANMGTLAHKHNVLFLQQRNGRLAAQPNALGAEDPSGRSRTVSLLRIRRHARPSLFVGDAKGIDHPSLDHIYVNQGKGFAIAHTAGLPSEQNTNCSSTADFDHDGRQDFLTCSHVLHLYRNLTPRTGPVRYREVAAAQGLTGKRMDAEFVDLNRDGWADVVTVTESALVVRLNRRHFPHFPSVDFRMPLAAGFSVCSGAANGDAATDLVVVQGLVSPTDKVQRPDWMLINAGSGRTFRRLRVPQAPLHNGRNGNGDTCSAIPDYQGKRSAWTINNGRPTYTPERFHHGYRQLVILSR